MRSHRGSSAAEAALWAPQASFVWLRRGPRLPGLISELAEDAGQFGAVGRAKTAEYTPGFGTASGADLGQDAGAVLGHLDQGGAPVAWIGAPPDQVPGLERVHYFGGRTRRDLQSLG